jgi:hypothetical protein
MTPNVPNVLAALVLLAGCAAPRRTSVADMLDRPIDCAVAGSDLAALEAAIPGAAERATAGVRLVFPVARIAGRVTGDLETRREIASGRTEDQLRARIAEIEAACPAGQPTALQGASR